MPIRKIAPSVFFLIPISLIQNIMNPSGSVDVLNCTTAYVNGPRPSRAMPPACLIIHPDEKGLRHSGRASDRRAPPLLR
jgi:hypothetical protein